MGVWFRRGTLCTNQKCIYTGTFDGVANTRIRRGTESTSRRKLGLCPVRPKRNTSKPHPEHKIYPYLLRGKTIDQPN
jgi:hypothetical protein